MEPISWPPTLCQTCRPMSYCSFVNSVSPAVVLTAAGIGGAEMYISCPKYNRMLKDTTISVASTFHSRFVFVIAGSQRQDGRSLGAILCVGVRGRLDRGQASEIRR